MNLSTTLFAFLFTAGATSAFSPIVSSGRTKTALNFDIVMPPEDDTECEDSFFARKVSYFFASFAFHPFLSLFPPSYIALSSHLFFIPDLISQREEKRAEEAAFREKAAAEGINLSEIDTQVTVDMHNNPMGSIMPGVHLTAMCGDD